MTNRGVFYGWVVVATAFICLFAAYGVWNSFPVFYVAILDEFGWSRSSTVLTTSIFAGVYALSAPLTGGAIDRFGPRVVMPLGAITLGLGLLATSRVSELWQLYLTYGLLAAAGESMVGTIANLSVLARWFSRRRGTAIGLASSGIGVGALLLVPAAQWIITNHGWRTAYTALGVFIVATIPALTLAFQRGRPEEMGLLPDGDRPKGQQVAGGRARPQLRLVDAQWAGTAWTVRSALATRRFWLLFCTFMLATTSHAAIWTHIVAYLNGKGFDPLLGASVVGFIGICSSFGKIAWGWLSDRIGREGAYSLGMSSMVGGVLILSTVADASQTWPVYFYAALFGLGFGAFNPVASSSAADLFQGKRFGSIYGGLWVGTGVGSSLGPWVSGLLFDWTGAYNLSLVLSATAACLSAAGMWLAAPRRVRQVPGVAARAQKAAVSPTPSTRDA